VSDHEDCSCDDCKWLELLHAAEPAADKVAKLKLTRAYLMDRITAIDDMLAELE
jgi:hypothetical protein